VIARVHLRPALWLSGLIVLAAGCDPELPGKPNPKNRPVSPENVLAFTAIFSRNCAGCHGADGTLGPAPPLNDPLFRSIVSESDLAKVLNNGRPGTPMPPFLHENGGSLTATQVQMLIDGIKGIRRERVGDGAPSATPPWGEVATPPAGVPSYASTGATGNVDRGANVFSRACSVCHGENGQGKTSNEVVHNRINEPAFLSLISDQALRRIIITGRPDLKMPNFAEKSGRPADFQPLAAADVADLVALLASWRKTP
jgi:cytochrome c oxidase cbb3-type subunit 3